jgi:HAD-superfamily hydrolase, subfamily IIB
LYRLLALDIDGTLLDSKGCLSEGNKAAVQRAADAGIRVVLATGRAYRATAEFACAIGLSDTAVVNFGGAAIAEYPSGKVLHQYLMPPENVREIVEYASAQGVYIQAYDGDDFLYQEPCEESRYYAARMKYDGRQADLRNDIFERCAKVLMIVQPDKVKSIRAKAEAHFGDRYRIVQSGPRFLEFFMPGVDKARALRWLGEYYGMEASEMLAMGDTGIDAEMLRYAGLGIAVANATEEAKRAADELTVSCDEDAVKVVIEQYILA